MKYLVLFLMSMFPLLSISAQNLEKMDSVQRNKYLIDLSSEVIKTMGPGYYRNTHPMISEGVFISNDGRAKIKKNIGRKYYEIKYPYDKSKETLEFDFSAKVRIWKDTGEPCDVIFGNGYGKNFSTCTVEPSLSACHPIAYFPLSNPSFHFSVDYCCSNNSKCSASLS